MVESVKEQLTNILQNKHGRDIKIISVKDLRIKGFAVKFIFLDDNYEKSELVRLK